MWEIAKNNSFYSQDANNNGVNIEKERFVAENLLYPKVLLFSLYPL